MPVLYVVEYKVTVEIAFISLLQNSESEPSQIQTNGQTGSSEWSRMFSLHQTVLCAEPGTGQMGQSIAKVFVVNSGLLLFLYSI